MRVKIGMAVPPHLNPPPILFGTNVVVRRGAGPFPSTGEGGVGVRINGAERPSFSPPSPPSPTKGGRSTMPPWPIEGRTVLIRPRQGGGTMWVMLGSKRWGES
jgi:hypothetical protein